MFFRVVSVRKNGKGLCLAILFFILIGGWCYWVVAGGRTAAAAAEQVLAIVTIGASEQSGVVEPPTDSLGKGNAAVDAVVAQLAAGELSAESLGEGRIFRSSNREKKQIALTFDDGPNEKWTEKYLALLAEKGVTASFFLLGKNAAAHPELVRQVAAGGHDIGIHSYDHSDLKKEDYGAIQEDLILSQDVIARITGVAPTLFRPPYGSMNQQVIEVAKEQGLLMVLWNVDPQDWLLDTKEKVAAAVLSHIQPGNIVVMHEGKSVTYGALPIIIDTLREQGYQFVTVGELIYESCVKGGTAE